MTYNLVIELEQETDGRWIAEIPALPGVMAYGSTQSEAAQEVKALASRVLIDQENSCGAYPTARVIPFVEAFPAGSAVSPSRTGDRYSPFGVAPLKAGTGSRFRSRLASSAQNLGLTLRNGCQLGMRASELSFPNIAGTR